jgi:hypothetical protein
VLSATLVDEFVTIEVVTIVIIRCKQREEIIDKQTTADQQKKRPRSVDFTISCTVLSAVEILYFSVEFAVNKHCIT